MPKDKRRRGPSSHLPMLVDRRFLKALDHPVRQQVLLATVLAEVSPNELAKALNQGVSQVSYHVRVLLKDCEGMIEETRTERRRGAIEHFYRASTKTLIPAKAWRGLKKGLRAVVGAGQASNLFNDMADALKAGKLQGPHDQITRIPLVLDATGQRNVKAIAQRATKEVEDEQRAVARRVAPANDSRPGIAGCTFAVLSFEAAWEPVDLHAVAGSSRRAAKGSGSNEEGARKPASRKAPRSSAVNK